MLHANKDTHPVPEVLESRAVGHLVLVLLVLVLLAHQHRAQVARRILEADRLARPHSQEAGHLKVSWNIQEEGL